jgi:protein tyrosine phosphatase
MLLLLTTASAFALRTLLTFIYPLPQDPSSIINITHAAKRQVGRPVAIHCSAGIGRTGVVCLAAHAAEVVEQARQRDPSSQVTARILVDGLVLLRQQREGMVQTDVQFGFAGKVSLTSRITPHAVLSKRRVAQLQLIFFSCVQVAQGLLGAERVSSEEKD